jgi:putative flippase GtrA
MRKLFRFLVAGLPGYVLAVLVNYLLVHFLRWPKPGAYLLVLLLQVTLNFVIARRFVFAVPAGSSVSRQYFSFMGGVVVFRGLDWALYTCMVEFLGVHFILAQLGNVALFSVLRFRYAQAIMEAPSDPGLTSGGASLQQSELTAVDAMRRANREAGNLRSVGDPGVAEGARVATPDPNRWPETERRS